MSFFNKKEEVINIELTDYGKEMLAEGVFKPEFYSFFDNDIIYNGDTFGLVEAQNNIENRILDETLLLKPQNMVRSKNDDSVLGTSNPKLLEDILGKPIGVSDPSSVYMPAWNVNFVKGDIESITVDSDVPRINLKDTYIDIIIEKNFSTNFILEENEILLLTPKPNGDDSYVKLKTDSIIASIKEENVLDIGENFIVEIIVEE